MTSKLVDLRVEKIVNGGSGLGRREGKVVFVPFTAPGDLARIRIVDEKKSFATGEVVQILEAGAGRTTPECPHFGRCGGCDWQHLDYPAQVSVKKGLLTEALGHRFPECRNLAIDVTPSPQPYGYRSRARIQARAGRRGVRIGFYRQGSHLLEDIECCPLLRPALNAALAALRASSAEIAGDAEYELACSDVSGDWAISGSGPEGDKLVPGSLRATGPAEGLSRTVAGFSYRLTPSAFFQANDFLIEELVRSVDSISDMPGLQESALELYAGVGLFTLPLARRFLRVAAVESSHESSALCRANLRGAGLGKAEVHCTDVHEWLRAARPEGGTSLDVVLLDPPRAGVETGVMEAIAAWNPAVVVYVSCDLQTLCRDASRLRDCGYRIDAAAALDLFPQTHHFETILRFRRGG